MAFLRWNSLRVALLASSSLASAACSTDSVTKSEDKPDGGETPGPAWTTQAYDVQSTWNDTNEPKLTKDNVGSLIKLWSVPLGLNSTVTAVGDRVYTAAAAGIAALNADTGQTIWRQAGTAEESIGTSATPTYDDGVLYIDNGASGYVYALDAKDGKILWRTQVETHIRSAGYSSPIVYGDSIYLGVSSNEEFGTKEKATFKGSVVALEKKSGRLLWQTYTAGDDENGCAVWSTVSLDPISKTVFAATGNNYTENVGPGSDSIFALDMATGDTNWHEQKYQGDLYTIQSPSNNPDADFGANPVVFDYKGHHLIAAGEKNGDLYVLDRDKKGAEVAKRPFGNGSSYIGGIFQALAWDGRYIYVVNNQSTSTEPGSEDMNGDSNTPSTLFALEPLSLDIVWERQLPAWVWAPMTLVNGMGFVGPETHLEAFDTKDGSKLFDFQAAGSIIGAPVVNNGRVYVPSGLSYFYGHPDDTLYALALPDDPAVGKKYDAGPPPDLSAPTFTNIYKSIFVKSCAEAQCHGSSRSGGLGMQSQIDAYASLIEVPAAGMCMSADGGLSSTCGCAKSGKLRVAAGKPEESLLVEKLAGNPSCGDRMPPTSEPISDELQTLVKNWIKAGAAGN